MKEEALTLTYDMDDHKIKIFRSLLHLVALDETDHALKEVDELMPIKDRLISLKMAYPEARYVLEVVLYQGHGTAGLSLDHDTLSFLAEIGAMLDCDMYRM